ncbi:MAG: N-acetyl-gamma-glutamyl-phosphate reductase [bacterium JZ-2024 1]
MALEHRVGILGASGYIAGELLRFVLLHPFLDPVYLGSRNFHGQPVSRVFPHLRGIADDLTFQEPDLRRVANDCDVCFVCLPHGESAGIVRDLRAQRENLLIVDLSADFRLRSSRAYRETYGKKHPAPGLLKEFVYALPEKYRKRLYHHRSLSAPGCFATSALLLLEPLRAEGWLPSTVTLGSVTGSSGSGASPVSATHHPERDGDFRAYQPLTHRHLAEIRQEIPGTEIIFVPHSAPMVRGIYTTAGFRLRRQSDAQKLPLLYRHFYAKSPFIRLLSDPPRIKSVVTTNYCDIAIFVHRSSVVVISALDNLVKGGAGQAVQAANIALGLPESTGLEVIPPHP